MSSIEYYPIDAIFGTTDNDTLRAGSNQIAIGLKGDDTLVSYGGGVSVLLGGEGNDTYIADALVTQITDSGGRDTLYVPGFASDYEGGFISGQHLLLYNVWSGHTILVMDFKGAGRIETFIDESGLTLSAQAVEDRVYREGQGDLPFREIQWFFGYDVDRLTFEALAEIDMVIGKLNWQNVFQHLAEAGRSDGHAIADAVQFEALPLLSQRAQQLWQESNIHQSLAESRYQGLETNIPNFPSVPGLSLAQVQDMALLYQAALDRQPDAPGLNYFVSDLQAGQSLQDIANSFYLASEFRAQFQHFDDHSYVNQLYRNVLDRDADSVGLAYWLHDIEVNGRSHADVLVSFAQSEENRHNAADWLAGLSFDEASDSWLL